ncbi:MAG TPA: hypothetical protein VIS10_10260 [Anaerolineales bacterium]
MLFLPYLPDHPAETSGYMIAGYVVIFGVMLIYLASLILRSRSLSQDLELLEDLQDESEA